MQTGQDLPLLDQAWWIGCHGNMLRKRDGSHQNREHRYSPDCWGGDFLLSFSPHMGCVRPVGWDGPCFSSHLYQKPFWQVGDPSHLHLFGFFLSPSFSLLSGNCEEWTQRMPPCWFQTEREVMGQCAFLETVTTLLSQDLCVGTYIRLLGTCTAEQQKNAAEVARSRILHCACTACIWLHAKQHQCGILRNVLWSAALQESGQYTIPKLVYMLSRFIRIWVLPTFSPVSGVNCALCEPLGHYLSVQWPNKVKELLVSDFREEEMQIPDLRDKIQCMLKEICNISCFLPLFTRKARAFQPVSGEDEVV